MKTHLKKALFNGDPKLLTLTLAGQERLDYGVAEWLDHRPLSYLLPFTYSEERTTRLNYDLYGLSHLDVFLKATVSTGQYVRLLRRISDVVNTCISRDIPTSSVWFGPHEIYVSPEGDPAFVLTPVKKLSTQHSSPLDLVLWLGSDENVRLVATEETSHVAATGDWARRQQVFTPEAFERFLAAEFPFESDCKGSSRVLPRNLGGVTNRAKEKVGYENSVLDPLSLLGFQQPAAPSPVDLVREDTASATTIPEQQGTSEPTGQTTSTDSGHSAGWSDGSISEAIEDAGGQPSGQSLTPTRIVREKDRLSHELRPGTQVLGRSRSCDISFSDNGNLSRRHCALTMLRDSVTIEDLGSSNGTYAGGSRLHPGHKALLKCGERFRLADDWYRIEA